MIDLEKIVKTLNFDDFDDDMFAELFTEEQIKKAFSYENIDTNPLKTLPEDYLWYLQNYGCRTIRTMEHKVQIDKNTHYIVSFDGLVAPEKAWQQYRYHTCMGSYSYRLEDNESEVLDRKFLPITNENKGEMLVMDIKEDIGSIWQFPSKEDCRKYDLIYQPSFVATSFTEFLKLVKPSYGASAFKDKFIQKGFYEITKLSGVWKDNVPTESEIFHQVLTSYETSHTPNYTEFKDEKEFLQALVNYPDKIILNWARTVELFYVSFGGNWKIKTSKDLEENIEKTQKLKSHIENKRVNYSIQSLKKHTHTGYNVITATHSFYETIVESKIHGLTCKEKFVLYKNPDTQLFSLVKRVHIEMEDLKIKGIGTFEYDFSWSSKRTKKMKWSKIPATIYLNRYQEDFTEGYFEFIKRTINDVSFKEKLEEAIFNRYQKIDYPEFLAMSKEDQDFFEEGYPRVKTPSEIWKLLGDEFDIHFVDNNRFDLQFEYLPDDEHGLNITVSKGKLIIA